MRIFKIIFFIPAVMILQMVLLPRFSFRGAAPDLILVSAIAFAVLNERMPATFFSTAAAFIQDMLSAGIYFNTAAKVIVSNVVSGVKEEFVGDEYYQTAGLTVVLTPLVLLGE
ncbi:hypothetical protein HZB08_01265, partial [Candidatus Saganbacteria bacterium]|nr:hypothetical protein [Candidatus Saganbacteria bacterium]